MVRSNTVKQDVSGGEVSQLMQGRTDLPLYKKALAKSENGIVLPQGGWRFRNGSVLVKNTKNNASGFLIPFQFSDQQAFLLEFTDTTIRFYKDNSAVLEANANIATVSNANPASVNAPGHGLSTGDEVFITGVVALPEVNDRFYIINVIDVNNFTLAQIDGISVNTSFAPAQGTGGTVAEVYEIASPYPIADIPQLQFAQNWNTMYICHQNWAPRKLTRTTDINWSIGTYVRTSDPFGADGSGDCPGSVCFTDTGRLVMGGTINHPETFWGSNEPQGEATDFDDFTPGANDTDGTVNTFSPLQGKTDAIQWLANTTKYMGVGNFGSLRTVYGATLEEGFTPTAINAKPVSNLGAARILPVASGTSLLYVQRGGSILRSVEYDFYNAQYVTTNRSLAAPHLTNAATITQIVQQQGAQTTGNPDCIWCVKSDGKLLGLTFDEKEHIAGWHKHRFGGQYQDANTRVIYPQAKIICAGIMLRPTGGDQVWFLVERFINNAIVRTVEYFADQPPYPNRDEYFTDDEEADTEDYYNYLYEVQKDAIHMDLAVAYDGSAAGLAAGISIIPNAANGNSITITSAVITGTSIAPIVTPTNFFTPDMVGKEIWKAYDVNGDGGGRCVITQVVNGQQIIATGEVDFDNTNPMSPGMWLIATATLYGLNHLEGNTVTVCADGGAHPDCVVMNGSITLNSPASKASAGLFQPGIFTGLNIDSGGVTGPASEKVRSAYKGMIRYLNTGGASFGTSPYVQAALTFMDPLIARLDRPANIFTGTKKYNYLNDNYDEFNKAITILQKLPLPCTILSTDVFMTTADA